MAIELEEVGRQLQVTVGGEQTFLFAPLSSTQGVDLALALFGMLATNAANDLGVDPAKSGAQVIDLTLGEHRDAILELRYEELSQVQQAVQLWQAAGGSFALAKLSLSDPKAAMEQWALASSLVLNLSYSTGARTATTAADGTTPAS